ncbi:aminoglycoside phosphotransferase family protein [Gorillibacterium massiliense]|uniref:aminoglycoside phosphotransferase family protein n=1 Tax=Gorillibacterium massiliense TaxID=1280390 RepID=UPI0004B207C1|nr:aminoglycoside phosphotransferase family protein [Gorillibacterium massiliense]
MGNPLASIEWIDKNEELESMLQNPDKITVHVIDQGFEAEVVKIAAPSGEYVLKTWSKSSRPDVGFQYHLLAGLPESGLSVSRPLGFGTDAGGHKVLLTSFDGKPIQKVNAKKMAEFAAILAGLHQVSTVEFATIQLPSYDFTAYFFPDGEEYADITKSLAPLLEQAEMKQDAIIHGDFHMNNLLEEKDRITLIDWTNAQLGDARYDLAWALVLISIYISERHAAMFLSAYGKKKKIKPEEHDLFMAIAYLRWILLNRRGGVPMGPETLKKVKNLMNGNAFLKDRNLV